MEKVAVAVFHSQFPVVLFSGSRFLNFADLTVLEPGTNLRAGSIFVSFCKNNSGGLARPGNRECMRTAKIGSDLRLAWNRLGYLSIYALSNL